MSAKSSIIQILNAYENDSGSTKTEYDKIYIYKDGPNKTYQVTLARGFTECGGTLWQVFEEYKKLGGSVANSLLEFKKESGKQTLHKNNAFLNLIINKMRLFTIPQNVGDI